MKRLLCRAQQHRFISPVLCFVSLVFLDLSFRGFYGFVGSTELLDKTALTFTLAWAGLLTALLSLLPRLPRRICMGVVGVFFALLTITHAAMYGIVGRFFTFADMNYAENGARFFSWTYIRVRKAYLICVLAALMGITLAILTAPGKRRGRRWPGRTAAGLLAVLCLCVIIRQHKILTPQTFTWGVNVSAGDDTALYRDFSDPNRCLNLTGLYQYTCRDLSMALGLDGSRKSVEELDEFYAARETDASNEMSGVLAGKNLIMIMMESVDTWLATPEYMPNLCELQQKSVDFTHFYTPLYLSAGTFATEITSQTGLIPASAGLPNTAYVTNDFPLSLANRFRAAGYIVNSFHSASPGIYSRGTVHTNLGFSAYHSYADMGMEDYMLDSQMISGLDQIAPQEGPFFSFIITYSGHGPYTDEMRNISDPHMEQARAKVEASGVTGTQENMEEYVRAVAHAMETDAFIGELVDALEESGQLENTALLLYADHYGKYMTDKEFLKQIKGVSNGSPELYRTPCFLYSTELQPAAVEKYGGAVDLPPTVVNLFGLQADLRYYVGDDLFGNAGGYVMLPGYSWYDGETFYNADYTGPASDAVIQRSQETRERMTASFDTLKSDYFAKTKANYLK